MTTDLWREPASHDRLRYAGCGLLVLVIFGLGGMRLATASHGQVASDSDAAILVDLPAEVGDAVPAAEAQDESIAKAAIAPVPDKPAPTKPDPVPLPRQPEADAALPAEKPDVPAPPKPPTPVTQADMPAPDAPEIESAATRSAQAKAISRWQNALVTTLEAAKHKAGRATRESGTVILAFSIDATGHLKRCVVSKSSGSRTLDDIALHLVEAAAPFPSPPAGMSEAMLAFTIPVRFNPRR